MTGRKNEMVGGIKEGLGKLTGDDGLEAEGAAQKNMGKAERKTSGAFHEAKGSFKKGVGRADRLTDARGRGRGREARRQDREGLSARTSLRTR